MERRLSVRDGLLPLPPAAPQFPPSWQRRLCAALLTRCGWRVTGSLPDCAQLVVIAAPHSSWWDGAWGLLCKVALGLDLAFMGKQELFRGPLGWALRRMGGIPIERSEAHGVVDQMIARFRDKPQLWLGIAPEGTRRRVTKWRSGFWQIARAADVPILPVAFDYPTKTITIGPVFAPSADLAADLVALRAYYAPFRGKHRGVDGAV